MAEGILSMTNMHDLLNINDWNRCHMPLAQTLYFCKPGHGFYIEEH